MLRLSSYVMSKALSGELSCTRTGLVFFFFFFLKNFPVGGKTLKNHTYENSEFKNSKLHNVLLILH